MVLVRDDLRGGGVFDAGAGKGAAVMDATKFDNEKLLRRRIRELEALLGLRDEEQRRMDREDAQVFALVHGQKLPLSEGCIHVVLR
ncbi:MAG: hypothetical protein ACI3W5_05790 [Faecousia sp.]